MVLIWWYNTCYLAITDKYFLDLILFRFNEGCILEQYSYSKEVLPDNDGSAARQ